MGLYKKNYDEKWNKCKINNIKYINVNREHFCRTKFIEFIEREGIKTIIEIGGGEVIEARDILSKNIVDNYSVVDVSDVFLKFAGGIDGLNPFKGDMIDIPMEDKEFDLIYCSSVLEHSPDIQKTIEEMDRVSNRFYFNMYKWKMKTGNLNSYFRHKKKYYTTTFNIDMLLDLIRSYGDIKDLMVYNKEGGEERFDEYRKNNQDIDINRNGKYLCISGIWR